MSMCQCRCNTQQRACGEEKRERAGEEGTLADADDDRSSAKRRVVNCENAKGVCEWDKRREDRGVDGGLNLWRAEREAMLSAPEHSL